MNPSVHTYLSVVGEEEQEEEQVFTARPAVVREDQKESLEYIECRESSSSSSSSLGGHNSSSSGGNLGGDLYESIAGSLLNLANAGGGDEKEDLVRGEISFFPHLFYE